MALAAAIVSHDRDVTAPRAEDHVITYEIVVTDYFSRHRYYGYMVVVSMVTVMEARH